MMHVYNFFSHDGYSVVQDINGSLLNGGACFLEYKTKDDDLWMLAEKGFTPPNAIRFRVKREDGAIRLSNAGGGK
jgi:hypothetical protein